ncbi:MAG: hypothetical protein GX629_09525, partial [Phycisphaerae bacterium]|nr:hypothetical protein [Phycisphaerae bacterium]
FGQLREDAVRLNLAYDQDGLYLAISDQKKIDGLENNDWQLIFPAGEKKEDRRFVCSLDQNGNLKQSDTLKWEVKAQETKDAGATLEAKIPWSSLGLENPAEGQKLRVKILRGSLREGVPLLGWGDSKVRGEGAMAEIILGGNEGTVRLSRIGNPSQCRLDLEAQIAGKTAKGHMDVFLQPSVLKEYYDPKTMPGTRSFTGKEIYHKKEFTGGALRFKESFDDADVNSMLIRIVDADGRLMYQSQRQFIANLPIVSTVKTLPGHERVEIQADVSQYRPSKKSKLTGRVRLFDPAGKEIKKAVIAGFPSPVQKVDVSMKGLPEGKILVRTTLYENNQEVFTHESSFVMMETRPDWIVHPAGAERRVTNDFIPLTLKQDDKAFVIGMWGREYRYAKDSLLPSGIVSQTRQLLARPAEFRFSSGKEDSKSGSIPIRILEQSPDRIRFVLQKRYDRFMVSTENTIEFDGMQWTTITIKPLKNRSSLEKVSLEFPLVPDNSTLIHRNYCGVSSKQFSGKTPDRWNSGFAPIVWIGNEYVGHCFFIETPAGLQIQDSARFYEVERTDRETLLRVNFVDQKITLDKPITFSFGWFATPSRPLPENWLSWAYYGRPGEEYKGTEFQVLLNDRCFDESNQFLHEAHPWKWFTDQAKIAHESGRHFLKYTSTHYLSFYKNWTKDALDQKKS